MFHSTPIPKQSNEKFFKKIYKTQIFHHFANFWAKMNFVIKLGCQLWEFTIIYNQAKKKQKILMSSYQEKLLTDSQIDNGNFTETSIFHLQGSNIIYCKYTYENTYTIYIWNYAS